MQTHPDLAEELGGINNAGSLAQLQFTFGSNLSPQSIQFKRIQLTTVLNIIKSAPISLMGAHIQQELKLAQNSLMGTHVQELNILSPHSSLTL